MSTGVLDTETPGAVPTSACGVGIQVPGNLCPAQREMYCRAVKMRDLTFAALEKATIAGKAYNVEGMAISRYDLDKLRMEYVFWDDQVTRIAMTGSNATMSYRRIIPLDIG